MATTSAIHIDYDYRAKQMTADSQRGAEGLPKNLKLKTENREQKMENCTTANCER